jgi:hypothetical protein
MAKFKYKDSYNDKNYKSEFIISCLQVDKKDHKNIQWAKEMKIMNGLVKKCSNPAFWMHARPEFKIPSLAWFITDKGRKYLNEKYKRFNSKIQTTDKKNSETKEDNFEKSDTIIDQQSKIKTLKDFLTKKT